LHLFWSAVIAPIDVTVVDAVVVVDRVVVVVKEEGILFTVKVWMMLLTLQLLKNGHLHKFECYY